MKPQWVVNRALVACTDGQRRWDYAYQFLLRWMDDQPVHVEPAPAHLQENQHGNCIVRPSLDQSPAADPDD